MMHGYDGGFTWDVDDARIVVYFDLCLMTVAIFDKGSWSASAVAMKQLQFWNWEWAC
jgi:hypothetical protein